MNAARVIHGIAAFMLLGLAFVMLREFGVAYKYGHIGEAYGRYDRELHESTLPWLSALVVPLTPISWWSALTPLFSAIGVAVRVPTESRVHLAIHWLVIVVIVSIVVLGSFIAYVKVTAVMGNPYVPPPTPLELGVNVALLLASGAWMVRGIILARRGC
jgi:hypothetical protein